MDRVVPASLSPVVPAGAVIVEPAAPVALGGVAGAGKHQQVVALLSRAEDFGETLMNAAAALAVTPGRHDHGTGDDPRSLRLGPADRLQELLGAIRVPVGEQ